MVYRILFARSSLQIQTQSLSRFRRFSSAQRLNNDGGRVSQIPAFESDKFAARHIGPSDTEMQDMLVSMGHESVEDFLASVIPDSVRSKRTLNVDPANGQTEMQVLAELEAMANKNNTKIRSLIGLGFYGSLTPSVILRNILEDPEWYTSYTPYQPEISQGRLESLFNFQTLVTELTGMAFANASMLDESSAAAEAMSLALSAHSPPKQEAKKVYLVDSRVHQHTIDGLKGRADGLGIDVVVVDTIAFGKNPKDLNGVIGFLYQYPDTEGSLRTYPELSSKVKENGGIVCVATDLLALTLFEPPAYHGADVVFGSAQRLGLPLGFGGPHAAFFATSEKHKRKLPGRLVGLSRDRLGNNAFRLALQTREQHIRREKATSNICTAQALPANASAMFAVFHGPSGLTKIATRIFTLTKLLKLGIERLESFQVLSSEAEIFDTLIVSVPDSKAFLRLSESDFGFNLRFVSDTQIGISLDETVTLKDLSSLLQLFARASSSTCKVDEDLLFSLAQQASSVDILPSVKRKSTFLTQDVFNGYHSETEILRYMTQLKNKDISLASSMIPLGSCTMKLNATTEMIPFTWKGFNSLHPFVPRHQATGYAELIQSLEKDLANITGFDAVSLQPNSGAQGEFTALRMIKSYLRSTGENDRDVCLIPLSAHGTNPASATMAGFKVVTVKCDQKSGYLDLNDLQSKVATYGSKIAVFMVTYPSTYGIFEPSIVEVVDLIHSVGGQVYLDGANMNAQIGLCSPGELGADVCHLNLHKTFCIPHGGGGPGVGPICVKSHLSRFLPSHTYSTFADADAIAPVTSGPWGSASILPISWAYIKLMGSVGLKKASETALLNANYMAHRLSSYYTIAFRNENGYCAHEFIIDVRPFKLTANIEAIDIAKRLMDYGFHAPTMSWPVPGTLMLEPSESESKRELDRYCDALISIRKEIAEIESGAVPRDINALKLAPHSQQDLLDDRWERPYSRINAAYPLAFLRENKAWPTVTRIDDSQ